MFRCFEDSVAGKFQQGGPEFLLVEQAEREVPGDEHLLAPKTSDQFPATYGQLTLA